MSSLGRVSYPSIEIDGDHGSAGIRAMRTKNTLVALTLLLAASRVSLAAENPLMGTWKLNESKSKYAPGSAKEYQDRLHCGERRHDQVHGRWS